MCVLYFLLHVELAFTRRSSIKSCRHICNAELLWKSINKSAQTHVYTLINLARKATQPLAGDSQADRGGVGKVYRVWVKKTV